MKKEFYTYLSNMLSNCSEVTRSIINEVLTESSGTSDDEIKLALLNKKKDLESQLNSILASNTNLVLDTKLRLSIVERLLEGRV